MFIYYINFSHIGMKEDDFVGIGELGQEYDTRHSDFFIDVMSEFLDK